MIAMMMQRIQERLCLLWSLVACSMCPEHDHRLNAINITYSGQLVSTYPSICSSHTTIINIIIITTPTLWSYLSVVAARDDVFGIEDHPRRHLLSMKSRGIDQHVAWDSTLGGMYFEHAARSMLSCTLVRVDEKWVVKWRWRSMGWMRCYNQ